MFESILIAGKGEVALRVEKTCRRIGIELGSAETVEGDSWHVDAATVLEAARRTGCQAVHPGYVCPSARAGLGELVRAEGLGFVGPSNSALLMMTDKLAMKRAAAAVGLMIVPGSDEVVGDADHADRWAQRLDYPVFLKPLAGTAGIGVVYVDDEDDMAEAFAQATAAAEEAFGEGRLIVERALIRPRQLEVTVVADEAGKFATLGERECSLQEGRRVMVAESPSPLLTTRLDAEAVRDGLSDGTIMLAQEMGLTGVATFEYLVDDAGQVYFLEANADMQGAILVTELMTGIDPIELQLEIASGEALVAESKLQPQGHAFEVRLCADTADPRFTETRGGVESARFPPAPQGKVRIEPAIEVGESVTDRKEPLLARMATFAATRHQALLSLDRTLAETDIQPVPTNSAFLRRLLNHEGFRFGQYDTSLAERLTAR